MEKNYFPGILWLVGGIICLVISHSGSEVHLVIKGTSISYGWLAVVIGVFRLLVPPED